MIVTSSANLPSPLTQNLFEVLTLQSQYTQDEVVKTTKEYETFVEATQNTIAEQTKEITALRAIVRKLKAQEKEKEVAFKGILKAKDHQIKTMTVMLEGGGRITLIQQACMAEGPCIAGTACVYDIIYENGSSRQLTSHLQKNI